MSEIPRIDRFSLASRNSFFRATFLPRKRSDRRERDEAARTKPLLALFETFFLKLEIYHKGMSAFLCVNFSFHKKFSPKKAANKSKTTMLRAGCLFIPFTELLRTLWGVATRVNEKTRVRHKKPIVDRLNFETARRRLPSNLSSERCKRGDARFELLLYQLWLMRQFARKRFQHLHAAKWNLQANFHPPFVVHFLLIYRE